MRARERRRLARELAADYAVDLGDADRSIIDTTGRGRHHPAILAALQEAPLLEWTTVDVGGQQVWVYVVERPKPMPEAEER